MATTNCVLRRNFPTMRMISLSTKAFIFLSPASYVFRYEPSRYYFHQYVGPRFVTR